MKRHLIAIPFLLVFAASCFCAAPASATCYECIRGGQICNGEGWCTVIYTCGQISGFCAACWEDCYEDHYGGYCHSNFSCQWTEKLPSQSSPGLEGPGHISAPALAP